MRRFELMVLAAALCVPTWAAAQVYKHVDKDGKVYYSDKPPAKDDPRSKKIDVDSRRNVIPPLVKHSGEGVSADKERINARIDKQNTLLADLKAAQAKVDAAKEALEIGKIPLDDDWIPTVRAGRRGAAAAAGGAGSGGRGNAASGGPSGMALSEAYYDRVSGLERDLAIAEEELAKAETAYRRGVPN